MQNIALGPKKNMFMGGKSILAVGDFRQVKIKSYTLGSLLPGAISSDLYRPKYWDENF